MLATGVKDLETMVTDTLGLLEEKECVLWLKVCSMT